MQDSNDKGWQFVYFENLTLFVRVQEPKNKFFQDILLEVLYDSIIPHYFLLK